MSERMRAVIKMISIDPAEYIMHLQNFSLF